MAAGLLRFVILFAAAALAIAASGLAHHADPDPGSDPDPDPDPNPDPPFDAGAVVATLADGTQLRERMLLKGQRYRWSRSARFSSRTPEQLIAAARDRYHEDDDQGDDDDNDDLSAKGEEEAAELADLLARSDEDLAEMLSTVMLLGTEEYREDLDAQQVTERAVQLRGKVQAQMDVLVGKRAAPSTGPRSSISAQHPDGIAAPTAEQAMSMEDASAGNGTAAAAAAQLLGKGPSRKLLGGGGAAEEADEEDIETYCHDSRSLYATTNWPFSAQIALGYVYSPDSNSIHANACSATLISRSTALSAAHCFYDVEEGSWASTYTWAPAYDSSAADPSPLGVWTGCYALMIKNGFMQQTSYNSLARLYDFAVINFHICTLPESNGVDPSKPGANGRSLYGYWPNVPNSAISQMYNRGYPSKYQTCGEYPEPCGTRIWGDVGGMSSSDSNYIFSKAITTSSGHSGSGTYVYWQENNLPYAVCIAIAAKSCPGESVDYSKVNRCHKITDMVEDLILSTSVDF